MKKTLFIGLGGCGLNTVARLAKKLEPLQDDDNVFLYLYADTDDNTRKNLAGEGILIDELDFCNLGSTNPYQVIESAKKGNGEDDIRVLEWASCTGEGQVTFPNEILSEGARAQRMVGRTALKQFDYKIKNKLDTRITSFQAHKDAGTGAVDADIWVVASSCGGTGSSLTLDILYLINRMANAKLGQNPQVKLVLYMPEPFVEANASRPGELNAHMMNGYSFMWELNALKQAIVDEKGDYFTYFSAVPWGYSPNEKYDLCKFVIPIDVETSRNTKISLPQLYSTTAEMLYYLNVGAGARQMVSDLCNDIPNQAQKRSDQLKSYSDTNYKWGNWLVPYGYHVIRKANDEFKEYLKKRATFEILEYGLKGEDIPNDAKVRDEAKKTFAAKYVLPFLMDVDGVEADETDSIKAVIDEEFPNRKLQNDIDNQRVIGFMRNVDDKDLDDIADTYLDKIKQSVNKGIGNIVAEHGLAYAYTLLSLVDDYYLTDLQTKTIYSIWSDAEDAAKSARTELENFLSKGVGKKNAAAVAKKCGEYQEAKKTAYCAKTVIAILDKLTNQENGYLEIVRNGDGSDKTGIKELLDVVRAKAGDASDDYTALSRSFKDSRLNAFTVLLPSVADIAGGENGSWVVDNEFEKKYYKCILDYDKERAKGINGVRIPARKNEGTNNLYFYIRQILLQTDPALFVSLALSEKQGAKTKFEFITTKVLSSILDAAIGAEGTEVNKWLKKPLDEYIKENHIDINPFTNPDIIPVLYPTRTKLNPVLLRYIYVGASDDLAGKFGHTVGATNTAFVKDSSMEDRFQIIELPVGCDFYSYKYFLNLQNHYFANRAVVLAESIGCHIHKAFRFLDLDKALSSVNSPKKLAAVRLFVKNLYYQQLLLSMKNSDNAAFNRLMGVFSLISAPASPTPSTPESGASALSKLMGAGAAGGAQKMNLNSKAVKDIFFSIELKLGETIGMSISMRPISVDTSGHLSVGKEAELFELEDVTSPRKFADGILAATSKEQQLTLMSMLSKVDVLEKLVESPAFKEPFGKVKVAAQAVATTGGTAAKPNFADLCIAWADNHSIEDEDYLEEITSFFNNVIR